MTYFKTLCRDIKLSKILDGIPKSKNKEIKEIIDILEKDIIEFTDSEYPDTIFYKRKNDIIYEVNSKENIIYVNNELFEILSSNFNLKHKEIKELVSILLAKNTKNITYWVTLSIINQIKWQEILNK